MEPYDYAYELTDEQLLHFSSLPAIAKLRWLDEARRFTLMARRAREAYYGDRVLEESAVPAMREPD
ncbi:MAG: hypothetical protein EXR30_01910 [Betaproteobacteria bacterium]|nr:hypothetical protein [Betaproteobacteria bacterium]MSQ88543.1 hypothetical protein [Betaproteobacteria bacterium]